MEKIGVIGIGKLGICLALNLERKGYAVTGVDNNSQYVDIVNNKQLTSSEPGVVEYLSTSKNFVASTQLDNVLIDDIKLIFIVVDTPSVSDGGYDHSQIETIANQIIANGKSIEEKHLVINCTTMPGYCDTLAEKLKPYNYTVSYNPEFIAQGSILKDQVSPDQVLIGEDSGIAAELIEKVYANLCDNTPQICRMSRVSAEITKLATNCFLTTKISFANAVGDLAIKVGAEPDKILNAIGADKRIGHAYLKYGFGYGGPCFPRDNRAFGRYGRDNNLTMLLSEATDAVNQEHLTFQFNQYLNQYQPNETILFDSVTYKKGTTIIEEAQQLALAIKLAEAGRSVLIKESIEVVELLEKQYPDMFIYKVVQDA
ncbi:MAG: UDP-glucose/GDP-mannose dehydrogenase family protein [Flavobacteriales bacterium]|nr:UDP-glucose/GDP-mannose dehydrogenase family protein [Flavobacteriales bacterium]